MTMQVYRKIFSEYQQGYMAALHILSKPADIKYSPDFKDDGYALIKDVLSQSARKTATQLVLFKRPKADTALMLNLLLSELEQVNKSQAVCVVDCADLAGKYIGETEKNLAKLIAQAETQHWILFFDEADALFGKRVGKPMAKPSAIKNSHDKFANLEVSHLLKLLSQHTVLSLIDIHDHSTLDSFRRLKTPCLY